MENKNMVMPLEDVTRLEVIDETGRAYVKWDADKKYSLSFQDNGKTLKIFIDKKDGK